MRYGVSITDACIDWETTDAAGPLPQPAGGTIFARTIGISRGILLHRLNNRGVTGPTQCGTSLPLNDRRRCGRRQQDRHAGG